MLFADYLFDCLEDGTIIMDEELRPDQIHVKNGDRYVVQVTSAGRVIFRKVSDGQHSGTN